MDAATESHLRKAKQEVRSATAATDPKEKDELLVSAAGHIAQVYRAALSNCKDQLGLPELPYEIRQRINVLIQEEVSEKLKKFV